MIVGADPELVIFKDDRPVNALNLLKSKGRVFADNALMEINFAPGRSVDEFMDNLHRTLKIATASVPNHTIHARASVTFPDEELAHPMSFIFGCNPEWDAWDLVKGCARRVQPPNNITNIRTAGGHIHIGGTGPATTELVRHLDLFVGIPCVLLDNDPTTKTRLNTYGGAGKHRITAYGLEYRTPSNFWVSTPALARAMYRLVYMAMRAGSHPISADVKLAIDNHDKERARFVYNNVLMTQMDFTTADMINNPRPHNYNIADAWL